MYLALALSVDANHGCLARVLALSTYLVYSLISSVSTLLINVRPFIFDIKGYV